MGDIMRNWKTKLTSRKFWAAVVGVVLSVMVIYGASSEEQTKVAGLITACGTLIAYIIGEGMTDKAGTGASYLGTLTELMKLNTNNCCGTNAGEGNERTETKRDEEEDERNA